MATQQLTPQTVNILLDPVSEATILFPIKDATGALINVSSGWIVNRFHYYPASGPNTRLAAESLLAIGTFSYGATGVTWTLPNNHGVTPKCIQNSFVLTMSHDAGATESFAVNGGLNIDLEGGLL